MRESHVSLVLLLAISVLFRVGRAEEANLVTNAGFESAGQGGVPEGWAGPVAVYSRDEAVKRSGAAALKFVNPDAKTYALCKQPLDLKPGCRYELSAWVKTEGVVGEDSGATVCLEWHTADGKYVGGQYPAGLKGNTGWKQIHSISGRVPEDGNRCYVLCYVRKGMTGTAWWDDVRVVRHREPPLSSVLRVPNYRGLLTDSLKEAHVRAYLNLVDHELKTDAVGLRWSLRREGEEAALKSGEKMPAAAEAVDLTIPAAGLAPGDYEVSVSLVTLDAQKAIGSTRHRLVRPAVPLSRRACIDEHQRLIHDGKPFFPLGMYWSGINEADLNTYADSAFNCLMPYGMPTKEQMDLAHARGLKVIYSVKDAYAGATWCPREIKTPDDERPFVEKRVTAFRDHPALLAWYLNDELPTSMMSRLVAHQRWLEELDPNHPTWVVLYQVGEVRQYIESFDVIGTDPYPIPQKPASLAGQWTRQTVQGAAGSRPAWQVPQVFNWVCYQKTDEDKRGLRPPTFEEMRSMAWQCLAEGANGLIFYSFFDLKKDKQFPFAERWPQVKAMAAEISEMMPALLSVEPAPAIEVQPAGWLHSLVRQVGQTTYLVLVNNAPEPHQAQVRFPKRPAQLRLRGGAAKAGDVSQDGVFSPTLDPLAVHIYEAAQ